MPRSLEAFTATKHSRVSLQPPKLSHQVILPPSVDVEENGYRTSLLDLPYEIRANILKYVLKAQPFLSSRQEISVSQPERPHTTSPGDTSTSNTTSSHRISLASNDQTTIKASDQPQLSSNHRLERPNPFESAAISFKHYAESRHADTSILYTCRQIRSEGLPLWYQYNYYLTLVLEIPHIPKPDSTTLPAIPSAWTYYPTSRSHIHQFWTQIHHLLRWPSPPTIQKFNKFHISLYIEDKAFRNITQPNNPPDLPPPLSDVTLPAEDLQGQQAQTEEPPEEGSEQLHTPLSSKEIISILLGADQSHSPSHSHTLDHSHEPSQTNETPETTQNHKHRQKSQTSKSILSFTDFTFLGLANDADERWGFTTRWNWSGDGGTRPATEEDHGQQQQQQQQQQQEDHNPETISDAEKVSFCIELWRS